MCERLLENNNNSVELLIKKINDIVDQNFSILTGKDDIEKWNLLPDLLLLDEVAQKRLLSFIELVDSLSVSIEEKATIIISLSGLLKFGNIKLYDYDDGSLYTLAQFYQHKNKEDITKTISVIGNKELLLSIRKKTLDLEIRKKILLDIEKSFISVKIDSANSKQVTEFINSTIKELEEKEYYEL